MDGIREIGWRQFSISVVELLRWPLAFVLAVFILRASIERLLDAAAIALRT